MNKKPFEIYVIVSSDNLILMHPNEKIPMMAPAEDTTVEYFSNFLKELEEENPDPTRPKLRVALLREVVEEVQLNGLLPKGLVADEKN
jgi:hypothetical protein